MRRYLLVLDMDLLAVDEQLGLEPISYLLARQEQPSEVVVLSLADHCQARLPALELLLGTSSNVTKFPVAPQPDHDIGAAAGHRMNRAVRHLRVIGCQASGLISDGNLVTAVRAGTRLTGCGRTLGNGWSSSRSPRACGTSLPRLRHGRREIPRNGRDRSRPAVVSCSDSL
jgi:hypothetical protein